jgi:hypothetical protein
VLGELNTRPANFYLKQVNGRMEDESAGFARQGGRPAPADSMPAGAGRT